VQVGHLSVKSVHEAVEKFGEEDGVKIRDTKRDSTPEVSAEEKHKSAMDPVFATLREGKKLQDHLGFEDGSTTLNVKTKASANAVYEHSAGRATEIANDIYDWISQEMKKEKEPRSFAQEISKTDDDLHKKASSWQDILNRSNNSKDDSTILR
jgi:hypothetical protein